MTVDLTVTWPTLFALLAFIGAGIGAWWKIVVRITIIETRLEAIQEDLERVVRILNHKLMKEEP